MYRTAHFSTRQQRNNYVVQLEQAEQILKNTVTGQTLLVCFVDNKKSIKGRLV